MVTVASKRILGIGIILFQFIVIVCLAVREPEVVIQEVEVVKTVEVIKEVVIESQPNVETEVNHNDFKSYMSYTAITDKTSTQWQLQQKAYTNADGIRCINGVPLVAVGTGWGLSVGDSAIVTCDNGNSFRVIIGDIKADIHTMADNKTTAANNCRCEFIVDVNALNKTVKKLGNISALEQYSGYVVSIVKA